MVKKGDRGTLSTSGGLGRGSALCQVVVGAFEEHVADSLFFASYTAPAARASIFLRDKPVGKSSHCVTLASTKLTNEHSAFAGEVFEKTGRGVSG